MITIMITGDRYWTDPDLIRRRLENLPQPYSQWRIVQGGAKGVDTIAADEARNLGMSVVTVYAQWQQKGKASGPIRNRLMLTLTQPRLVIAFHPNLWGLEDNTRGFNGDTRSSKGTRSMVNLAQKAGLGVEVHDGRGPGSVTLLMPPMVMEVTRA